MGDGSSGAWATAGVPGVRGRVADGFEAVVEAFGAALAAPTGIRGAGGAAVAVTVAGVPVVDLWGGARDAAGTQPWEADTRAVVFSSTKALVALSVLTLVQAGGLSLDDPVARYWPGFAQHGKGAATVRQALAHRAGVPVVDARLSRGEILAWTPIVDAIAAQRPLWEPGTRYEYHSLTYGWLGGELIRRVGGSSPGDHLREVFSGPLGLRTAIGVPVGEQGDIAEVIAPAFDAAAVAGPADLARRAISINDAITFPGYREHHDWNDADLLAAQVPGANGVSSARDLATLYGGVVGGPDAPGLLRDDVVRDGMRVLSSGQDFTRSRPGDTPAWGAGIAVSSPVRPMFGAGSFGHDGAGGQFAFGDLDRRTGFAWVTNRMGDEDDTRANDVAAVVLACLDRRP